MTNEMPKEIYVTEPVKGTGTGFYAQTDFDGATKYVRADYQPAGVDEALKAFNRLVSRGTRMTDGRGMNGWGFQRFNSSDLFYLEEPVVDKIRAALTAQRTDVNKELLEALKASVYFAKEVEKLKTVSVKPDLSKWIKIWDETISRAEQKGRT